MPNGGAGAIEILPQGPYEVVVVVGNDVVVVGLVVVVEIGCAVSIRLLTLASPHALIVPTLT